MVLVRPSYLTLRPVDGDDDIEVLAIDLQVEAEPATARTVAEVLDLRILDELEPPDRKVVDVWLDELDRYADLIDKGILQADASKIIIENVNRRLGTDYSPRKVQRQRAALEASGVGGLLDGRRFGLANMPPRAYDARLVEAFAHVVGDQTRKSTGTGTRVIWLALRELEQRHGPGVVPVPSRATLFRLLGEIEGGRYTFGSARTRRTKANQPSHMFGNRVGVRPGEQVLIDTTPMEIMVECDGQSVRPDLTILLDEASRSVLSAIVTVGTRSIDLVVVLARALVPYAFRPEGVRANRRATSEAWIGEDELLAQRFEHARDAQAYIFPETITTDHGSAYVSRHFTDACRSLGISLTLAAKYTPTHKAKVEKMFDTIKVLFTQYAISFLGESPDMRGDESISTSELLTLEQLQELLEDWIAVAWQNRPHSALRDPRNPRLKLTPNQMVDAFREIAPEFHVPLDADRYLAMLPTRWRTVLPYGINLDLRIYDSEALSAIRNVRSRHRNHGGKWPIHVDPYNPMTVWIEIGDSFVPLTWRSPHNGAPMANEVWRVARAQAATRGEEPSQDDLNEVMRRFMNTGNKPLTAREKKREKSNASDLLGITNQIAKTNFQEATAEAATSADSGIAPTTVHDDKKPIWPVAPPFGFTRQTEGG
ncbi:DDE-type integrase/transposase/recombinase [Microbacterium murale]|uniref:Integrase catalytic domain-containing protein n=1 Tax=Microbacterium murale TaxID=1081040 RepID=A0ABQ1RZK9_9MICO|nr:DDE-type integrase/transposase/recombinase [Microbacterium murale]GGD88295.1 hypothetical protein GCM10007269_33820 [Microbacterium murale]